MLPSLLRLPMCPAAIACALLACASCGRAPDPAAANPADARAPVEVRLARVQAGTLPRVVRATGTLAADDVVTVASEVAGRIVALTNDVGDRVKSGELLARVDDADYVLERDQRRRALSEVLAGRA